jgi:hypothetical protein
MFGLLLSVVVKVYNIKVEPTSVPLWTEEELESFVRLWLVILSAWIKTAMFLLYHYEGCNICEMVLHECYVNDLHTIICSGMLGHHRRRIGWVGKRCPIELIFGQYVGKSYVYLSTKFRAVWICILREVRWLLKRTETVVSLSLLYLTSCGCCCCCRWATRRSVL